MKKRQLGSTGIHVNEMGYGVMHLSIDAVRRPSEAESITLLQRIVDELGVDFLDTADAYCVDDRETGHNERLLAKALDPERRARVTIATKGGFVRTDGRWERDGSPAHLRAACEASLRALGTDCIDLYQHHVPDERVPVAESVGTLARLQSEGKIRQIGVSNYELDRLKSAQREATIVSVQNQFSVINQREDEALLRYCEEQGISYIPWNPVGGRGKAPALAKESTALEHVAARHGASAHQIALAWLLRTSPAMLPIPGTRSFEHVADNVRAADIELSEEDMQMLEG